MRCEVTLCWEFSFVGERGWGRGGRLRGARVSGVETGQVRWVFDGQGVIG